MEQTYEYSKNKNNSYGENIKLKSYKLTRSRARSLFLKLNTFERYFINSALASPSVGGAFI